MATVFGYNPFFEISVGNGLIPLSWGALVIPGKKGRIKKWVRTAGGQVRVGVNKRCKRVRQRDGGREGSGETRERLKEKMTLRLNYFWNAPSLKV